MNNKFFFLTMILLGSVGRAHGMYEEAEIELRDSQELTNPGQLSEEEYRKALLAGIQPCGNNTKQDAQPYQQIENNKNLHKRFHSK